MKTPHHNAGNRYAKKPEAEVLRKRIVLNCTHKEFAEYVEKSGLTNLTVQKWIRERLK